MTTVSRLPSEPEAEELAQSYHHQMRLDHQSPSDVTRLVQIDIREHDSVQFGAWTGLGRILMNTDEFITWE